MPIFLACTFAASIGAGYSQEDTDGEEEIFNLSPFEITGSEDEGYRASSTLAGTRLRTQLEDVGAAIQVLTNEFIDDLGGTDASSVLSFATNTETNGVRGDLLQAGAGTHSDNDETERLLNPSGATRVRGLVKADNTRNYFRSSSGWDSYNVDRVDLLRGPNSILFGLGSPGGVMNASTISAQLNDDAGKFQLAFDEHGTVRANLDYNKILVEDQLAIRFALLEEDEKFAQDPAYEDQSRQFVTATYRPAALNDEGKSFAFQVDFENGSINSNRPRFSPPNDYLTAFTDGYSIAEIQLPEGSNYNGYTNGIIPAVSTDETIAFSADADLLMSWASSAPGVTVNFDGNGIRYYSSSDGSVDSTWALGRGGAYGALMNNSGATAGNPFGPFVLGSLHKERVLGGLTTYATNVSHPFASQFSRTSLSDETVFDFYNTLIDGTNKREWSDWDNLRFSVSNTFMDNLFGYELSYFQETSDRGQTTLMGNNNRFQVDLNQFLREDIQYYYQDLEGTAGTEEEIAAALAANLNPNYGRVFIQDTTYAGNRMIHNESDGYRASAFLDYDFRNKSDGGWLSRLAGRHVLNGVIASDYSETFTRVFQRHVYPDELLEAVGFPGQRFNNNTRTAIRYYVSDSLVGATSTSGLNLSGIEESILDTIGTQPIQVRVFDTTWIADDSVLPGDAWGTVPTTTQDSIQGRNPANYVGWVTNTYQLIDALSGDPDDLELATRTATISSTEVDSKILSWQGYFWDNAVVGTFGYREDEAVGLNDTSGIRSDGGANIDPSTFGLDLGDRYELKTISKNHSLVVHLNKFTALEGLPIKTSLTYNKGENFQPAAGRLDNLGDTLPPPQGETEEFGILLSSKDNKYSLRATKFETSVINATSTSSIPQYYLDLLIGENGSTAAADIASGELRELYDVEVAEGNAPTWSIDDQENINLPAWYAFESALDAAFPNYVDQWLVAGTYSPSNAETRFSRGGVTTEDTVSKGYEFEFVASPVRGLRIAANASKTEAYRSNAPGSGAIELYEFIDDALWDDKGTESFSDDTLTDAGALRSSYSPFGETGALGEYWRNTTWPQYQNLLALNGQKVAELPEWKFNMLAHYTFSEGRFKGLGLGTSFRWEDERAIGYYYMFDQFGNVVPNLESQILSDTNERIDLNVNYKFDLKEKMDWKIQLNVFNVFGKDELRPVVANPDGSIATYRIQEGLSWRLTNTLTF
ncbi:TonB-dependent receptor plug domain-containing protein [Pelagicoccus albus]|uniref:TonB-dependent receptor plug domain-containing protein n=1 Tax=Pelagicoccus albus TaxID=415222 RepID=A0A7X1B7G0_9BACT|nr:TonB-dependent receptor plug domain-containing protein [Pelagicoccus albus]MBC2607073.1 hypothetical protein [Pelagicoccus albus]